jgi:hypothetical protein
VTGWTLQLLGIVLVMVLGLPGIALGQMNASPPRSTPRGAAADTDGDGLRDAFETRWGISDPARRDTDRDGLSDAAEDPDGDRLGNLGEQRSRTSPTDPDSDDDGVRDGAEDRDRDGRSNAAEQDHRPVPGDLQPRLVDAAADLPPSYRDGCHITATGTGFRPCVYGRLNGKTTVLLFGDSHAAQWLPALIAAARTRDWRIVSLTRSGCPSADVHTYSAALGAIDTPCERFREQALSWIRTNRPDIVVTSNLDSYLLRDRFGVPVPKKEWLSTWIRGLRRTVEAIPSRVPTVILADTPYPGIDVPACLRRSSWIDACLGATRKMLRRDVATAERALAQRLGVGHLSRTAQICPYRPCPVIVESLLIYRDQSHLTAAYARQLGPGLGAAIEAIVAGTGDAPAARRRGR